MHGIKAKQYIKKYTEKNMHHYCAWQTIYISTSLEIVWKDIKRR